MKQFQLKKTCSNRYHFGSTSLSFFSKPLTTRPRWPSLMTNTMTADPRTQWCGVCRSIFFCAGWWTENNKKRVDFSKFEGENEVYEQGIYFCWEIFVCKFNTCSWRLKGSELDEPCILMKMWYLQWGQILWDIPALPPLTVQKWFLNISYILMGGGGYLNKYYIDFRVWAWREVYINRKLDPPTLQKTWGSTVNRGGRPWLISVSLVANPLGDADIHIPARKRSWENHVQRYGRGYVIISPAGISKKNKKNTICDVFRNLCMEFLLDLPGNVHDPKLQAWRTGPFPGGKKYGKVMQSPSSFWGE